MFMAGPFGSGLPQGMAFNVNRNTDKGFVRITLPGDEG
jgi:hypothetical protein